MINLFLFLGFAFLIIFILGRLIEKIKIPFIFAALFFGFLLAIYNPFINITSSLEFNFLAQLGMYFLLFVIGFEIDLKKFKKQSKFIVKATSFIILFEAFFGTLLVHFVFGYQWLISFVVALSFATVGEAILIPILDEFKIVNTRLGQTIIGIGVLDDVIEIFSLILVIFLIGSNATIHLNVILILISLFVLVILAFGLTKLKKEGIKFSFLDIDSLFIFILFILFLFLGIGVYAEASAIAALLAGISLKTFLPKTRFKAVKTEIKTMCYGFFAPIFFLWIGASMNVSYLISNVSLVFLVLLVSFSAKILASWLIAKKRFGTKQSMIIGIGLSVRFSTSIIIIKILFDNALIDVGLYSVIIASSIVFKFVLPVLFSNLIAKIVLHKKPKHKKSMAKFLKKRK